MKIDYKELADLLLDHYCESWGVDETIYFLYHTLEYNKEHLLELDFKEEDIDRVINYKGEFDE